eukprot:364775-Chlamydomonas_euryale.AAC.5
MLLLPRALRCAAGLRRGAEQHPARAVPTDASRARCGKGRHNGQDTRRRQRRRRRSRRTTVKGKPQSFALINPMWAFTGASMASQQVPLQPHSRAFFTHTVPWEHVLPLTPQRSA